MSKGGARVRSGPAPDPNALRRERDEGEWIALPPAGREGPVPDWPLSAPTKRELGLWGSEWTRPQAVMWERNGQELEVAMFVRAVRVAESAKAPTAARTLVRQLMDSLGITVPGMNSLKWRIGSAPQVVRDRPELGPSVKDRLKVVQGGG